MRPTSLTGLLLGAFDRELSRVEVGGTDLLDHHGRLERRVEQAGRHEVQRVMVGREPRGPAIGLDALDPGETHRDDVRVELDATIRVDRGLDDRPDRLGQHRHVGRNRHSYSYSSPLASRTIGWYAKAWRFRRLKK
jgi:hypothetical protein